MRYKVTVESSYLRVEAFDRNATGGSQRLLHAVAEAVFDVGKLPILFCALGAASLTLADVYLLARYVIDTPLRHCRIALLYDVDPALEASRFIDTLAKDRRLEMAAFHALPDAVRWLANGVASRDDRPDDQLPLNQL